MKKLNFVKIKKSKVYAPCFAWVRRFGTDLEKEKSSRPNLPFSFIILPSLPSLSSRPNLPFPLPPCSYIICLLSSLLCLLWSRSWFEDGLGDGSISGCKVSLLQYLKHIINQNWILQNMYLKKGSIYIIFNFLSSLFIIKKI